MRVGWLRVGGMEALGEGTSICKGPEAKNEVCVIEVTRRSVWLEHQDEGAGRASGDRQGPSYGAFGRTFL